MQLLNATKIGEVTEAISAQARSVERLARNYMEAEEPDEIDRAHADLATGINQLGELHDQLEALMPKGDVEVDTVQRLEPAIGNPGPTLRYAEAIQARHELANLPAPSVDDVADVAKSVQALGDDGPRSEPTPAEGGEPAAGASEAPAHS